MLNPQKFRLPALFQARRAVGAFAEAGGVAGREGHARRFDCPVIHLVELRVARMVVGHEGVVAGSVVAEQHGPTPVGAAVLVAAMHDVAVEEQRIARFEFDIDEFVALQHLRDALEICSHLFARRSRRSAYVKFTVVQYSVVLSCLSFKIAFRPVRTDSAKITPDRRKSNFDESLTD